MMTQIELSFYNGTVNSGLLWSLHKLRLHLGVGRWSEKLLDLLHKKCKLGGYVHGQMPKNANVICEGSLLITVLEHSEIQE